MNLCSPLLLLGLVLVLAEATLAADQCHESTKPMSLVDPYMMYGRLNFIMGYADSVDYKKILKLTDSHWMMVKPSPYDKNEVYMQQYSKMNGTCSTTSANITIDGVTASTSMANISSTFHILPSCKGCVVFSLNSSTPNLQQSLQALNISGDHSATHVFTRAIYLMGREDPLSSTDLENFKEQAKCMGFSGEPDYNHNPKNEFCEAPSSSETASSK